MVLDKYNIIVDPNIVSGQDGKTGKWYCKELRTKTTAETKKKIGELNKIYNAYNQEEEEPEEKPKKKPEKEKP